MNISDKTEKGNKSYPNPLKRRNFGSFRLVVIGIPTYSRFLRTEKISKFHPFESCGFSDEQIVVPARQSPQVLLYVTARDLT